MAAPPLQLEIQGDQSHFRFDVPGPLEPRLEPVWKEAANPPQVVEIREVWEIPGARLVSTDGSPAAFWREWTAFLARLRIRGQGFPLWVRLIRDPASAAQVVWTLGPPDYERFKIEQLSAGSDELAPTATWRVLVPVTLVLSAVQRFADPNGMSGLTLVEILIPNLIPRRSVRSRAARCGATAKKDGRCSRGGRGPVSRRLSE